MARRKTIGNRVAPTRFLIFFVILTAGVLAAGLIAPWWRSVMIGFNIAAVLFIGSCFSLYNDPPAAMRRAAIENDANRSVLLLLSFALMMVILVAVGSEMTARRHTNGFDITLTILTLLVAWAFANTVYALHYAHLYYTSDDGGKDMAGVRFPAERGRGKEPTFSDFVYLAFTIGSALSVSDTEITSVHTRKVVTMHSIAAFVFNVGVFALTVNMLAGN